MTLPVSCSVARNPLTLTLDYTDDVQLDITGANEDAEGNYYIVENEAYTVHCNANGNPAPEVNVYGPDGLPITVSYNLLDRLSYTLHFQSGSEAIAHRSESLQYITCTANNNDGEFQMGEDITTKKQLSVYCKLLL